MGNTTAAPILRVRIDYEGPFGPNTTSIATLISELNLPSQLIPGNIRPETPAMVGCKNHVFVPLDFSSRLYYIPGYIKITCGVATFCSGDPSAPE